MAIQTQRIAILTSGGDSPGMNPAIYGLVQQAIINNIQPYLVYEGYKGLVEDQIVLANQQEVIDHFFDSGTFIYSARLVEFKDLEVRKKAVSNLKAKKIDTLVVIGGDGSYQGAKLLSEMGINVIVMPGTIDNDVSSSDYTIGFYSALEHITRTIQEIISTSVSHNRVSISEVMGRHCGDLAVYAALATKADLVITSENIKTTQEIVDLAAKRMLQDHKRTFTVIVCEHIYGEDGRDSLKTIAQQINDQLGIKTNLNILTYGQRGQVPTPMERILAMKFAIKAFECINEQRYGVVLGLSGDEIVAYNFQEALNKRNPSRIKLINLSNRINGGF
ncbi:ATP-dependent 6-phosphofructokinase [Mycoplasmoides gallisepticum]|uniref:6-phosphofructokinase n=2 Tax=Mycoplasmoides gallisepticum TaxID=2096 RepID=Q7NB03_MYCGA|nr:ATP-dependent 6-phosphofructokinase [Mycoplasmoides gallisepticum]AAP56830.2 6-phosphofructokinase [Mycoplasmoides gallisepticum str. R(low)]ADC30686.1 6-phosphofructokinase [Mycoplasmoides gallisepticum str. R(high)]ADC31285.1 6-phosphofructokinase [Mycoplasmoides gallisepticum str. F]OBU78880.1 6-phosphofructokinase [Mycoplasmoides gallisepticum]OBU79228.1 6-phosphofructokinase [Mycoplasmoides gallisepticum]